MSTTLCRPSMAAFRSMLQSQSKLEVVPGRGVCIVDLQLQGSIIGRREDITLGLTTEHFTVGCANNVASAVY